MTIKAFAPTTVAAILSLVISVGSFIYTIRTFTVTHRPYVGVTSQAIRSDATTISWRFIFKNTGSVPAKVRIARNEISATTGGVTTHFPTVGDPSWHTLLMPGAESEATGQVRDGPGAKIAEILAGRTTLQVDLVLAYEATGAIWWPDRYRYSVKEVFRPDWNPPGFLTTEGDAD